MITKTAQDLTKTAYIFGDRPDTNLINYIPEHMLDEYFQAAHIRKANEENSRWGKTLGVSGGLGSALGAIPGIAAKSLKRGLIGSAIGGAAGMMLGTGLKLTDDSAINRARNIVGSQPGSMELRKMIATDSYNKRNAEVTMQNNDLAMKNALYNQLLQDQNGYNEPAY